MSFDDVAIRAKGLGKVFHLYARPSDRLRDLFSRRGRKQQNEFWALRDVDIQLRHGEILGIVGRNGAGKSTLLQLISGTLKPTHGELTVNGRVAALLELGAGFNPEFTGRQNVFMNAAILGLSRTETQHRFDAIAEFADIGQFIDQPVKTYSSGMLVRLAFSVAICVDPEILVIDEALSVGDGAFARKSFDRIMALKDAGKTILFCSHSTYHVEALCNRAIWLRDGRVALDDEPASVTVAYTQFLSQAASEHPPPQLPEAPQVPGSLNAPPEGSGRILRAWVTINGDASDRLKAMSGRDTVAVSVGFSSDPMIPSPSIAVIVTDHEGRTIASSSTHIDGVEVPRSPSGHGHATISFAAIPLLKGEYLLHVMLLCERGMQLYDYAGPVGRLHMAQTGLELGVVALAHSWSFQQVGS